MSDGVGNSICMSHCVVALRWSAPRAMEEHDEGAASSDNDGVEILLRRSLSLSDNPIAIDVSVIIPVCAQRCRLGGCGCREFVAVSVRHD